MDAYEIMHEWDRAIGNPERSDAELDRDIASKLPSGDYEPWKALLEARNVEAIKEGMRLWGLPITPLKPFELDEAIETIERTYGSHHSRLTRRHGEGGGEGAGQSWRRGPARARPKHSLCSRVDGLKCVPREE